MPSNALAATVLALCFGHPRPVAIEGYSGHAMEPFITRDGGALFFNSRNGPNDRTDIFWARRRDDLHFQFLGPVPGANSPLLDGVPSLARNGAFAFISARAFDTEHATLWTGHWDGRTLSALHLERALTPGGFIPFNMDAEISSDGATLYYTANHWAPLIPRTSDIRVATFTGGAWTHVEARDAWFARVNTNALEYAPATSEDERELYFTRLTKRFLAAPRLEIMVATRPDAHAAFSAPARIPSIDGFVEAPTVAPDGALYFHAKIDDLHRIFSAPRDCNSRN